MTYDRFEVSVYLSLFILAVISVIYWEFATTATLISFVAVFGYSKFYEVWQLKDKIENLEEYKKLYEEYTKSSNKK